MTAADWNALLDAAPRRLPLDVLAAGDWPAVVARVASPPPPPATPPQLEAEIDRTWSARLADAARRGQVLFDGQILRYVGHADTPAGLELRVAAGSYRRFIGTNVAHGRRCALGPAGPGGWAWTAFENPVGITAMVLTADRRVLLGRRSPRAAVHPGYAHAPGGMLDAADATGGVADVLAATARELAEEVGLSRAADPGLAVRGLGLVRDRQLWQPELIAVAASTLAAEAVLALAEHAHDRGEHTALEAWPTEPAELGRAIRAGLPLAPTALGGLLLLAERVHGRPAVAALVADLAADPAVPDGPAG